MKFAIITGVDADAVSNNKLWPLNPFLLTPYTSAGTDTSSYWKYDVSPPPTILKIIFDATPLQFTPLTLYIPLLHWSGVSNENTSVKTVSWTWYIVWIPLYMVSGFPNFHQYLKFYINIINIVRY